MAQRRKTREELEIEEDASLVPAMLQPITPLQQSFVAALLSGKNVSESAIVAGIPRRTATYWLSKSGHPVRVEYEKQRLTMRQEFRQRIATLHEKALQSMEAALSEDAPRELRFAAAKFIYQQSLAHVCNALWPQDASQLVESEVRREKDQVWSSGDNIYIERMTD